METKHSHNKRCPRTSPYLWYYLRWLRYLYHRLKASIFQVV